MHVKPQEIIDDWHSPRLRPHWFNSTREIVRRFGRFLHREEILGRESTEKEVKYLNSKEAFRG